MRDILRGVPFPCPLTYDVVVRWEYPTTEGSKTMIIKTDAKTRVSLGRFLMKPNAQYEVHEVGNVLIIIRDEIEPITNPEAHAAIERWFKISRNPDGSEKSLSQLEAEGHLVDRGDPKDELTDEELEEMGLSR